MELELAGGVTMERASASRAAILRRAPEWWRALASKPLRDVAAAKVKSVFDDKRHAGWLVGVVAPGESEPVYCPQDQRTLPERFAPSAWDAVLRQVREGLKPVGLWSSHVGRMLACTSAGTLRFDVHPVLGLTFEAKIPGGPLERALLRDISVTGLGVSVAFHHATLHHEQRDGRTIRVVTACTVEHVAVVTKASGQRAVYAAARAFGVPADKPEQLEAARLTARTTAWRIMRGSTH